MKRLSTIIFLFISNLSFAQDTLKNNYPIYFISKIEIRYELKSLEKTKTDFLYSEKYLLFSNLDRPIKPFSPDEFPPYFDLELNEVTIFDYQSGFEIEPMSYFWKAEDNLHYLTSTNHYSPTSWIFTTNFDIKESVNFYKLIADKNGYFKKNHLLISSLNYQKEKFLRSVFEWNSQRNSKAIHFNFSHVNNLFYRYQSNAPILLGDRSHVFFPKKYHEKINSQWIHSTEVQNQYIRGSAIYAKLFLSVFKNSYLKFESDLHWFYLSKNQKVRQNFSTIGIGLKPLEETFIFLEYTNRRADLANFSTFSIQKEKPYFSLYIKKVLKLRLFK